MNISTHKPTLAMMPWFEQGLPFAQECLMSRGYGFIRGGAGTGKTRLGEYIQSKWVADKLTIPFRIFPCPIERTTERLARSVLRFLQGSLPTISPFLSQSDLSMLVLEYCSQQEGLLLYVDGAQALSPEGMSFFTTLLDMAQDRGISLAILFSIHNPRFATFDLETNPNFVGSLSLRNVERTQMMEAFAGWMPEFEETKKAYFALENESTRIARKLFDETQGNFQRMTNIWRSALSMGPKSLTTLDSVTVLLSRRHPEKFALAAEPAKTTETALITGS